MTLKQNIQATIECVFSESKEELQQQAVDNIMKLINAPDGKEKWKLEIDFEAHSDWKPLDPACWIDCPLNTLTKLSHTCRAREIYKESEGKKILCPMAKFAHKEKAND